MPSPDDYWSDEDAGPVVRPYAVIRGRTRPSGEMNLDLVAMITATWRLPSESLALAPEHLAALRVCIAPISLADLASDLDLPLGVVRILVGDLREHDLIAVSRPAAAQLHDPQFLREVANGLRRL